MDFLKFGKIKNLFSSNKNEQEQETALVDISQDSVVQDNSQTIEQNSIEEPSEEKVDTITTSYADKITAAYNSTTDESTSTETIIPEVTTVQNNVSDDIPQDDEEINSVEEQPAEEQADILTEEPKKSARHLFRDTEDCNYFGYDESTITKFHLILIAIWTFLLNTLYIFTIGGLVVAPITFMMRRFNKVVERRWVSLILACTVYAVILGLIILVICLAV